MEFFGVFNTTIWHRNMYNEKAVIKSNCGSGDLGIQNRLYFMKTKAIQHRVV